MSIPHVRIKALKQGVQLAGLNIQSGQVVELDMYPSQYKDALAAGDIAIDADGKTDLDGIDAEPVTTSADNAPKAYTPQMSPLPEVTGSTPEADKAVTDAKAKRGPVFTPKADK